MPPKVKVTREQIIEAAVELVRKSGADAINSRAVAKILGVSTQPIFSNYSSTDNLREDVRAYAADLSDKYIIEDMSSGVYPAYKAIGMGYIRFAQEEKELFKLLFMCDRSQMKPTDDTQEMEKSIDIVQENLGLDRDSAKMLHVEMWIFVHGIATMFATRYLEMDTETVSSMLTDIYNGLISRYKGGNGNE